MAEDVQQEQQATEQPVFGIEKIYVKDASVELPNAPEVFLQREEPQINIELHNSASLLGEGVFQVMVTATVTSKIGDKTAFLIEVAQAGIFRAQNIPQEGIEPMLAIACPNIIFPYLRETVSDLVTRAGFPPVLLSPVNFEALYLQQKQQQAQSGEAPQATTH